MCESLSLNPNYLKFSNILLLVLPDFDGFSIPQYSPANRACTCSHVYQIHQTPLAAFVGLRTVYSQGMNALLIYYCTNSIKVQQLGYLLLHVDELWKIWDGFYIAAKMQRGWGRNFLTNKVVIDGGPLTSGNYLIPLPGHEEESLHRFTNSVSTRGIEFVENKLMVFGCASYMYMYMYVMTSSPKVVIKYIGCLKISIALNVMKFCSIISETWKYFLLNTAAGERSDLWWHHQTYF